MTENKETKQPEELGLRMTIAQHLDELRRRLVRASVAVLLSFVLSWGFVDQLMGILLRPHYQAMNSLERTWDQRQIAKILLELREECQDETGKKTLGDMAASLQEKEFQVSLTEVRKQELDPQTKEWLNKAEAKVAARPKAEIDKRPIVTTYTESMGTYLKAAFIVALLFSGPYVVWELWGFIAAGLYPKEKTFISKYFPLAVILFFSGIAFGYFVMIPVGLEFLINFGGELVRPEIRISEYFSLFLTLTFVLGLMFQIPMVMIVLARLGIVEPGKFRGMWKFVVIGSFVVAAIATPTFDPVNQTLLAGSMYVLYELGILLAKMAYRDRQRALERRP